MRFSRFFIDRPIFAAAVSIVIFIAGAISIFALPISEYPEVVPPSIVVRAVYPGANPRVLAEAVAAPLEEQINGVENMLYVSSQATSDGVADPDRHLPRRHRRRPRAGAGAKPRQPGAAALARGGAPARRHHRQELAQHHHGRAPGVARQPLRHGVPAQLRRAAGQGRAGAHSRRRPGGDLRCRRLRHARVAGSRQGRRARVVGVGRGERDPRPERAGRGRRGRRHAHEPAGRLHADRERARPADHRGRVPRHRDQDRRRRTDHAPRRRRARRAGGGQLLAALDARQQGRGRDGRSSRRRARTR